MDYDSITYEQLGDHVVRLTLNRPDKLNAMNGQLLHEFDRALDDFEGDRDASVLIIRGAGRAFCAGYDLQPQPGGGGGLGTLTVTADRLNVQKFIERWQRLWTLPKPTIAQVHGYCLAGGTELAGHCDLAIAADDAQFGHPAGRALGVLPSLSLWPYLIGMRKSKELFFTGDLLGAAEALEWGLINRVVPRERLDEETLALARRIAMVPLDLLTLHKAAVNRFYEVMGLRAAEQSAADLDVIAHQTPAVKQWAKTSREQGLKAALAARDQPFVNRQT
ncbi:MAG: enoyl-CoA hydratase/isomerase family protein [Deltaproteobacteria bacterium]|nr:enoyl-CoA hydratase/isomerase family protein [Deltaproteobacteria bacterium]MBI3387175.1 enoyl-CoA hydratase/isomerase family protein [Deltaproteobacteria bacterium]